MSTLIIDNITKTFNKEIALNSICLRIDHGLFGLLGQNGAGKTTLMRVLATILKPNSGDIIYGETRWDEHSEKVRNSLGYLPQTFNIFKNITGYECLDYIAQLKGIYDKKTRRNLIEKILEKVNLSAHAHKKTRHYSGGMKRRLGIAQALIGDPKIVIIDEPTAGLDPEERIRFRNLLRSISTNRIVILSTHIIEDIETTCSSIATIKNGTAVQFDTLNELCKLAEGYVWSLRVKPQDAIDLQTKYNVISYASTDQYIEMKILSKKSPSNEALPAKPTLQDGFLIWNQT